MTASAPLPAALRPYVGSLWVGQSVRARREHVIPSGEMHLAVRIDGPPLRPYASRGDRSGHVVCTAVVCGPRSRYYAKRVEPGCTVGAQLLPGASRALFGVAAATLAEGLAATGAVPPDMALDRLVPLLSAMFDRAALAIEGGAEVQAQQMALEWLLRRVVGAG